MSDINLSVYIEINGKKHLVGKISGDSSEDAVFSYDETYIKSDNAPISVSLPIQKECFSPEKTRVFFSGLLPEGFTKREVARQLKLPQDDYLSIISVLGRECIGAIQILEEGSSLEPASYEELSIDRIKRLAK